jgi:hypothetical protein
MTGDSGAGALEYSDRKKGGEDTLASPSDTYRGSLD